MERFGCLMVVSEVMEAEELRKGRQGGERAAAPPTNDHSAVFVARASPDNRDAGDFLRAEMRIAFLPSTVYTIEQSM